MKKLPLRNNKREIIAFATIDDQFHKIANLFKWYLGKNGYPITTLQISGKKKHIYLHREVLKSMEYSELEADHQDHDLLNCQMSNLKPVTRSQNMQNRAGANRNSRTGIRGVSYVAKANGFAAEVMLNGSKRGSSKFFKCNEYRDNDLNALKLAETWIVNKRLEIFTNTPYDKK